MFLDEGHEVSERKTWSVIALCMVMMLVENAGGWLFGSIALIGDRLHISTHAAAAAAAATLA